MSLIFSGNCHFKYHTFDQFIGHLEIEHKSRCVYCKKMYSRHDLQSHLIANHPIKEFFCIFCGEESRKVADLREHMSQKHPEKLLHIASRRVIKGKCVNDPTYIYIGGTENATPLTFLQCRKDIGINSMGTSLIEQEMNRNELNSIDRVDEFVDSTQVFPPKKNVVLPSDNEMHIVSWDAYEQEFQAISSAATSSASTSRASTSKASPRPTSKNATFSAATSSTSTNIASTSTASTSSASNIPTIPRLKLEITTPTSDTDQDIALEMDSYKNFKGYRRLLCKFCTEYITNDADNCKRYLNHLQTHFSRYYKCSKCDEIQYESYRMAKHFIYLHKRETPSFDYFEKCDNVSTKAANICITFRCDICNSDLISFKEVKSHFSANHPESICQARSVRIEESVSIQEPTAYYDEFRVFGSFKCSTCKEANVPFQTLAISHKADCEEAKLKYIYNITKVVRGALDHDTNDKNRAVVEIIYHCLNCDDPPTFASREDLNKHHIDSHANNSLKFTIGKFVRCEICELVISSHNIEPHYANKHPTATTKRTTTLGCKQKCGVCLTGPISNQNRNKNRDPKHSCYNDGHTIKIPHQILDEIIPCGGRSHPQGFASICCGKPVFKTLPELVCHAERHRSLDCRQCKKRCKNLKDMLHHGIQQHSLSADKIFEKYQDIKTLRKLCAFTVHFSNGFVMSPNMMKNVLHYKDELIRAVVDFFQKEKAENLSLQRCI